MGLSPYALKQAQAAFETNHIRPNPSSQITDMVNDFVNSVVQSNLRFADLVQAITRFIELEVELESLVCNGNPSYDEICRYSPSVHASTVYWISGDNYMDGVGRLIGDPRSIANEIRDAFSRASNEKAQQIANIRQQQQQRASRVAQESGISQRHQTQQESVRERQRREAAMRHQRMAQRDQRKDERKQKQEEMEQERLRMKKALAER